MELEIKSNSYPDYCMNGIKIESEKRDLEANSLTVSELKNLIKHWIYQVILEFEKQPELTALYYSRKQTAKLLDISLPVLDNMIKTGSLPTKKLGKRVVILSEDIKQLIS